MRCAAVVSTCDLMSTGDVRGGNKVAENEACQPEGYSAHFLESWFQSILSQLGNRGSSSSQVVANGTVEVQRHRSRVAAVCNVPAR